MHAIYSLLCNNIGKVVASSSNRSISRDITPLAKCQQTNEEQFATYWFLTIKTRALQTWWYRSRIDGSLHVCVLLLYSTESFTASFSSRLQFFLAFAPSCSGKLERSRELSVLWDFFCFLSENSLLSAKSQHYVILSFRSYARGTGSQDCFEEFGVWNPVYGLSLTRCYIKRRLSDASRAMFITNCDGMRANCGRLISSSFDRVGVRVSRDLQ